MSRTTLDIDSPVLDEVKRIQRREGRSLGQVVSRLLADALASRQRGEPKAELEWTRMSMGARIDLADKDALYALLDEPEAD
ncbi:MAG: antitoxin [Thermoanaerobaculia bacterium]